MGKPVTYEDVKTDCDPIVRNSDLGIETSLNGSPLVADEVAIPCGLIAKSVFTDAY
jgi:hypothetical protein